MMKQHAHRYRGLLDMGKTGLIVLATGSGTSAALSGCSSNAHEPVGTSRTVEKRTVETPEGKTTITETREKDTRIVPR